jgi:MFS family permease
LRNSATIAAGSATAPESAGALLPIMGVVFVGFLVIGIALPVLPLHVHDDLGLGTFLVGLVTGSQFAAALISRPWVGTYCDRRGAKQAVVLGLVGAAASGLLYLLSIAFKTSPNTSVAILIAGRTLLGCAESAIITGGVSWGLSLVGPERTGKVIAWIGAAMFGAFAVGAPIGSALYGAFGFEAIAQATAILPLLTLLAAVPLKSVDPLSTVRPAFWKVMGAVWLPGTAAALGSVGFGAITAFVVLLHGQRGFGLGWLAYTLFAGFFILARLVFGDRPDRMGGARVATASMLVEAVGLSLIAFAPSLAVALAGAALTGLGYALVYPGLGVEAVKRAPPESRGLATAAYTAFLDVALGFGTPLLGLAAGQIGLGGAFALSALAALGACALSAALPSWSSPNPA